MNAQLIESARSAYRAGDFSTAVQMFNAAKDESEVCGEVDHLRGNALMKLGMYPDAAEAYTMALEDASYGKRGALLTNRGKAYAGTGNIEAAIESFQDATGDTTYATPYKAYMGLGRALMAAGRVAEAGTAFRQAAIDGANPAPAMALSQLGSCFVKLGRSEDAIETYRTALDFAGPRDDVRSINASLGQALVAAERYTEAVEAFQKSTSDGIYQLTPDQQNDLARAQDVIAEASAQSAMSTVQSDAAPVDPLDPMGKSGQFMPDPSDTGFFTMSESELIQEDRRKMKVRRKNRHTGAKVLVVIIILLIVAAAGLGFAYTRGFGFPSQQRAVSGLFEAVSTDGDTDQYLASSLSDSDKSMIVSSIPDGAEPTIVAMDQSMSESTARVSVSLPMGGTQTYEVKFTRSDNMIGWVVSGISIQFGDTGESTSVDESEPADAGSSSLDSGSDASASGSASAAPESSDSAATSE